MNLVCVARVVNDFPTKFGLPRQSGLNPSLISRVVMEKDYARPEFLRGIERFSHLWLLWGFDKASDKATVRPPKLGGNERLGVFATRSPFRPNPLGLSCVKLEGVTTDEKGAFLTVRGADMKSGTPVFDIKPYLPYADAVPDAQSDFAQKHARDRVEVVLPEALTERLPQDKLPALMNALSLDPRPQYISDPGRVYGFYYAGKNVRFRVDGGTLTVTDISDE
ncbi:MAG: tRNA (N6-threonylcarbamoyladenosine(37)-N6)-methyltransferase TrmO [Clostridia bacterium]|nr:tRNA (N6-threonylcarbamoyladenosine(37)-N6)-methyltransferase TrmO [Clostridia bacterium]